MTSPARSDHHQDETRDGFRFRGGHAALDLTATLAGRLKPAPRELLTRPEDVVRWLRAAGFTCARDAPGDDVLAAARRLREAIYAVATARLAGKAPAADARKTLNAMARAGAAVPEIDAKGHVRLRGDADALLALVAREAIALLGGDAAARVRQCEAEGCAILFVDTSRSGERRWCSMAACGNRHKVAEFRARKKGKAPV